MKGGRYKWLLLVLLSGAFFFHQADRAIFGLLTIPIQDELGLTDVQIGWINTVLSWTLGGMAFLVGPICDRFSRKWIITFSLLAWSLMTFMLGFAGNWRIGVVVIPVFFVVMFFRSIATGVGESFYGPCYPPLIAAYHKETRAIALSIHQGALYVGLMASGILTAWALGVFGSWRQVFVAFGGCGFALGVLFIFALRDEVSKVRRKGRGIHSSYTAGIVCFFKTPSAWCAMAGFVSIVFANNAYLFWAPKFMAIKFGVDVGSAGTQTMLWHHLFAFAAIIAGGLVTDRLVPRLPRFRIGFQLVALLVGAPCLILIGMVPNATVMVAMTAAYGICRGCFEVNTHASLFDVIPPEFRSAAVGIFALFAFLVGGLSGVLMGWLSQTFGVRGFELGFWVLGIAYLAGALIMSISFFATFKRDRIGE